MEFLENSLKKLINNNWYHFVITLSNADGYTYTFPVKIIKTLVLNDKLDMWWNTGSMTYDESLNIINKNILSKELTKDVGGDSDIKKDLDDTKKFIFRNDGRDYLDVDIKPLNENTDEKNSQPFPDEYYRIKRRYVIYDKKVQDLNPTTKQVTLYFWDDYYQSALEKIIPWSTATSNLNSNVNGRDPSSLTDDKLMMPSGMALKSFLSDLGFKTSSTKFDTTGGSLFVTSYADSCAEDTIEYIIDRHISGDGDICFLSNDRVTGEFELIKLSDLFKGAGGDVNAPGELQLEHFMILDSIAKNNNPILYKAPFSRDFSVTNDVKGVLKSYRFIDNSGQTSTSNFINRPVITYNHKTKTYVYNASDSTVKGVIDDMMNKHIKNNVMIDGEDCIQIKTNSSKNNFETYNVSYTPIATKGQVKRKGYGELLRSILALSNCMEITLEAGNTLRRSGTFIGIDSSTAIGNSDFDNKVCGQWLVMSVTHSFNENSYSNEMLAVKPYQYKKNELRDDV